MRRGNFHRSLVGLDGDEALFGLDGVAGFDQQFDDRDLVEVADVGNLDVHECHVHALKC
ncbi:hypothetical protein D3C86_2105540 [compost metagenome]